MSVIPKQARYAMLPLGVPSSRRTVRVNPIDGGAAYAPDAVNVVRMRMPQQGYLDCQSSYLTFKCGRKGATAANSLYGAVGALAPTQNMRMENGGAAWIKNLSVVGNDGTVIENIQNYNLLQTIVGKATLSEEYLNTPAAKCAGWGDDAQREAWLSGNKEYAIQLNQSGLMNNPKYLPLKFIAGGLELVLELAPTAECFNRGAGTSTEYEITGLQYVCDIVDFNDEFDNMFRQQMASEGVNIHFDHYKNHVSSIDSQQPRVQLSERTTSLKSCLAVMRVATEVSGSGAKSINSLSNWRSTGHEGQAGGATRSGLSKYNFTLGAERYPRFDLDCGAGSCRAYSEAQKAFGNYGDVGAGTLIKYYSTAKDGSRRGDGADRTNKGGSAGDAGAAEWSTDLGRALVNLRILTATQGADTTVCDTQYPHGLHTGQRVRVVSSGNIVSPGSNFASASVAIEAKTTECFYIVAVVSPTQFRLVINVVAPVAADAGANYLITTNAASAITYLLAVEDENAVSYNDDRDFFIGQNFEVHNEGGLLRTGLDVTAAVPLHIEMEFDSAAPSGLRLDAFVHTDKVAQLGADGLFVVAN